MIEIGFEINDSRIPYRLYMYVEQDFRQALSRYTTNKFSLIF